ncbi:MAG: hypothetical protein K2X48_04835 [Chitinophagaceae bacterium]|nr:hypothetical protein [Chitinophagaceae bacterium]
MKYVIYFFWCAYFVSGCKKGNSSKKLPKVSTSAVVSITSRTAIAGGNILDDGASTVTERGVVWNEIQNPSISSGQKQNSGTGIGSFQIQLQGLTPKKQYYLKAYAINAVGISYGDEISFTTIVVNPGSITDIDGNTYQIIDKGYRFWISKNLNVSKYKNGDLIPQITDPVQWRNATNGAWCYYNNDPALGSVYGKLYNWYAVNDPRGLAPEGWRIPAEQEWMNLVTDLAGPSNAGGFMKTLNLWQSPNTGASNSSGFSALPGGQRYFGDQSFLGIGTDAYWWSAQTCGSGKIFYRKITHNSSSIGGINNGACISVTNEFSGFSVRCVKDY